MSIPLWDTKEWKAMERPHHRLFDAGDDVTVDRVHLLDNIIVLCTGCAHDDADCIMEVAQLVRALQEDSDRMTSPGRPHHPPTTAAQQRPRCPYCPDGGDVVESQYHEVCRVCGVVCGETRILAVNAFRVFADDTVQKSHHGSIMDQRNAFENVYEPTSSKQRKTMVKKIIVPVCHNLQLLDSVAKEAVLDCDMYLMQHPRVHLRAKDMRLAKRLAAAAIVRVMLHVYTKDYCWDPVVKAPRRRYYNGMDTVFPVPTGAGIKTVS